MSKATLNGTQSKSIVIPELKLREIEVEVEGVSPFISHVFSEKARKQIRDKHSGKAKQGKHDIRNPHYEFLESMHWLTDKPYNEPEEVTAENYTGMLEGAQFGISSLAFKNAFVETAKDVGMYKTSARKLLHVQHDFSPLSGEPVMHEDTVVVGNGAADLRYRAYFHDWTAVIRIEYNASLINEENILNLVRTAGYAVGVGDWRPEKNGQNGRWKLTDNIVSK